MDACFLEIPSKTPTAPGQQEALERARESQDLAQSQRQIGGQVRGKMDGC